MIFFKFMTYSASEVCPSMESGDFPQTPDFAAIRAAKEWMGFCGLGVDGGHGIKVVMVEAQKTHQNVFFFFLDHLKREAPEG